MPLLERNVNELPLACLSVLKENENAMSNDVKIKTKTTKKRPPTANNYKNDGPTDCDSSFDTCMTACSGPEVGLFGRKKTPNAGTCALVCSVQREGCSRCVCMQMCHIILGSWRP